ncbi:MAG: hypothetical protein CVU91_02340 [Firmicutes bacterium HGW-Firmicutes-16]|nr:MAG: hypothetical protein CVU91_02340 [Firmicutes bacterium HGW-Firmicutes-16]
MKVMYDLNKTDFWNINKYILLHTKARHMLILELIYAALLVAALFLELNLKSRNDLLIYVIILLLLYVFIYIFVKIKVINLSMHYEGIYCGHLMEVNENEIIESTSVNETHYRWTYIKNISQNEQYIFIFFGYNQSYVIPKRAFNSDGEASDFFYKVRLFWIKSNNI